MTEQKMIHAYDAIPLPPEMERQMQERINAVLEKPMRETRVILKPKGKARQYALTAAAAVLLIAVGLWGVQRLHVSNRQPTQLTLAAQPEATAEVMQEDSPADYLSMYCSVLKNYCLILSEEIDGSMAADFGISGLCLDYFGYDPLYRIGYILEDLNGDGVPELLIGAVENEDNDRGVLFDLYTLSNGVPMKLADSRRGESWYDCGGGVLMEECASGSLASFSRYQMDGTALCFLDGIAFHAEENGGSWYQLPAEDSADLNGKLPISRDEAETWQNRYCQAYRVHSMTPFAELNRDLQPTATPEPGQIPGLTEEEYAELRFILGELRQKEETFALSDYAARQIDGVVLLLEQLERYSESVGLVGSEIRGLLYGRENLDGASAEAYADFLPRLYQRAPAEFLWAWHEAGEPVDLMLEITGKTDPQEALAWLQQQWAVFYAAEARENAASEEGERQGYAIMTLENGQDVVVLLDPRLEVENKLLLERLSRDELLLRLEREVRP